MPKFDFYPSFNAGEVSPMVDARTSLDKYRSACRTLENFQILPYGGVIRRPGTQYVGTTKYINLGETRLIGFNFSTTTRFVIELGVGYLRVWNPATGALQAISSGGTEIGTMYVGADLREIQYCQVNDIMYFAHANYPPYKLTRVSDTNWTFEKVKFAYPPLLDSSENQTKISSFQSPLTWSPSTSYKEGEYVKPVDWYSATAYAVGSIVNVGGIIYRCITAHTSGSSFSGANWTALMVNGNSVYYKCLIAHTSSFNNFGTDVTAGKWSERPIPLNEMGRFQIATNTTNVTSITSSQLGPTVQIVDIEKPDSSSTLAYVTTSTNHNLVANDTIVISGSSQSYYNTTWSVQSVDDSTTLRIGVISTSPLLSSGGSLQKTTNITTATNSVTITGAIGTRIGAQIEIKWQNTNLYRQIEIVGNFESETLPVDGAWDFETSGTWGATIQIMRVPAEIMQAGKITATANQLAPNTITVYQPNHGWSDGDNISVRGDYAARNAIISNVTTNGYEYAANKPGVTGWRDIYPENISQMEIVREYIVDNDKNIITSGTEESLCGLKIVIRNAQKIASNWAVSTAYIVGDFVYSGGKTYYCVLAHTSTESFDTTKWTTQQVPNARLDSATKIIGGVATILTTNDIDVDKWLGPLASTGAKTKYWQVGAFNMVDGYPRSVCLHEQRLCFGGTKAQPNTIWCSAIGDFENFELGVNASDAVQFTLAASEGNRINWMFSQSEMLVGTSGDEWTIGAADSASALSATNVKTRRQASYGSKYMRAAMVNDVLLFVQRNGRKVRELVYELNKDGWVAPDLTLLAEHITNGEIVEIAYQQQPDAILWCVRGDGTLIGMTYERDQKVVGWHRHTIADNADVESVATIYGNGTEDEVWMVVKRTVSGQTYRTIERFPLLWRAAFDNQTSASWRYLDGHVAFASGAANRTISGLDRFNGKTVTVVQEGQFQFPFTRTVSSGAITVPTAAAGYVGLPYTSTLTPMKLDMDLEDGSSQGRKKRIHKVVVRTQKSQGGEVRVNAGQWYDLAATLTTGDQKILTAGTFGFDADVSVQQSDPYPMCILAIEPVWDAYGNE